MKQPLASRVTSGCGVPAGTSTLKYKTWIKPPAFPSRIPLSARDNREFLDD